MSAMAAVLLIANLQTATLTIAPRVPGMTASVVNVRATRRLIASSLPFGAALLPRHPVHTVGSGVIIASSGLILTNEHVVRGASEVKVQLADHRELPAFVVGTDQALDIALLRVDSRAPLPVARLGRSERMRVGDFVTAVGNPFGLSHSVTSRIVSTRGHLLAADPGVPLFQTDASINPGNSGGPLYDLRGQVIALNTAIVAGAHGIRFAVPIDIIRRALPQLERDGRIRRGFLGVHVSDVPAALTKATRLPRSEGALVESVRPGGPGAVAGILPGDVIVRWDGERIASPESLPWRIELTPPGTQVHLTVLREGDSIDRAVQVGTLVQEENAP